VESTAAMIGRTTGPGAGKAMNRPTALLIANTPIVPDLETLAPLSGR
jgi:hypothetical protein